MTHRSPLLLVAVIAVPACIDDPTDLAVSPFDPTRCELSDDGPSACPRREPLVDHGPGDWTVLDVRSAVLAQSHCAEISIWFSDPTDSCDAGPAIASAYFLASGGGAYDAVTDRLTCLRDDWGEPLGPPPGQPTFVANVNRVVDGEPIAGTGVIQVEDTFLDNPLTRGAVDVVFPDGTRLLADFAAPLCATE